MFFVPLRSIHCWKSRWRNMTLYYTAEATPVITETEAGCGNNARAAVPFTFRDPRSCSDNGQTGDAAATRNLGSKSCLL